MKVALIDMLSVTFLSLILLPFGVGIGIELIQLLILLLTKLFKILKSNSILQDTSEAKQNVDKRIGYINGELKRQEDLLAELDKKQEEEREKLQTLQNQMQKLAQA
jgi:hypothetical protein